MVGKKSLLTKQQRQDRRNELARASYYRNRAIPEKLVVIKQARKEWRDANKPEIRRKQREGKRARKLLAIEYLGGKCQMCSQQYHPAAYEFHHRNPEEKDRDPSKMLQLSWAKVTNELDKCDLLCANCHRVKHHEWG